MQNFIQYTVDGLTLGSVYALIALGYTLVYGVLKLLNFAHGDVFMVGTFVGYGVLQELGGPANPKISIWLVIILVTASAMVVCAGLGVTIERFAYRPLRDAPRIAPLITALGVSFFLENSAQLILGAQQQSYNSFSWTNSAIALDHFTLPAGAVISYSSVIVIVGAIVLVIALTLFVQRTQTGKAMRATSFDREAAAMMGIDVDRVIVVTFFIGSALAGAAGVFNCLAYQQVFPTMGFQAGLFAFTAAVVGGIGNLPGSVLGGLLIGLAEAFSIGYISSTFEQAIVFAILIVVMLVRPSGILGRAAVQKV